MPFFNILKKYKVTVTLSFLLLIFCFILVFLEESFFKSIYLTDQIDKQSLKIKQMDEFKNKPIDWVFKDREGHRVDLASYKGKKSITVNLWASWCAPCIEELPALFKLAKKTYKHNVVLAITSEPLEKVNRFLKNSFPDLSRNNTKKASFDSRLIIIVIPKKDQEKYLFDTVLPVTYLFNKQGLLDQKIIGAKDWIDPLWLKYIRNL